MGADKALLDVAGTSMIVRVAAALREAGCEPLVVGHSSSFSGLIAIPDDLPGQAGPAAGLATALRVAAGRPVVLVAADQPFLRPQTIRALLALEGDAIVPIDGGANQATCAVYRAECLVPLRKLMAERPSPPLQALLDRVSTRRVLPAEWSRWGEEGHSWWSLDTPEDVLAAEAWLEENPESRIQHPAPRHRPARGDDGAVGSRSKAGDEPSRSWKRAAGILLHVTSLPGPYGIGDLGPGAHDWLGFLSDSEMTLWQILPLGPTGSGDSPYQSFSSSAGNTLLISPQVLAGKGLIEDLGAEAQGRPAAERVDFAATAATKSRMLRSAYAAFSSGAANHLRSDLDRFLIDSESWLPDFSLFMALKDVHGGLPWTEWPDELRDRDPDALVAAGARLTQGTGFHQFCQFLFFRQWDELRREATRRGISIIGGLPIYVAADSVDVWVAPHLFRLDAGRGPAAVAGVPPDAVFPTGQLWGNPLYDWNAHQARGYTWWIERFRLAASRFDIVRIDHFRAFADHWEVPPDAETAEVGLWRDGPGIELFEEVESALGRLSLIAEDLGDLSPQVPRLRDALGLPGMKVLQDAFRGDDSHEFLPHRYPVHSVAFTGTHDNNTSAGWYDGAPAAERAFARSYLKWDGNDPAGTFIRAVWESAAVFAIAPLQDFLRLGGESRMNTPATTKGNWQWRLRGEALSPALAEEIRDLNRMMGRASQTPDSRQQTPDI